MRQESTGRVSILKRPAMKRLRDTRACASALSYYVPRQQIPHRQSYQAPPRAVRIPRAFSAAAIARDVVAPVACIWRTTGSTFAAKASAAARLTATPFACTSDRLCGCPITRPGPSSAPAPHGSGRGSRPLHPSAYEGQPAREAVAVAIAIASLNRSRDASRSFDSPQAFLIASRTASSS